MSQDTSEVTDSTATCAPEPAVPRRILALRHGHLDASTGEAKGALPGAPSKSHTLQSKAALNGSRLWKRSGKHTTTASSTVPVPRAQALPWCRPAAESWQRQQAGRQEEGLSWAAPGPPDRLEAAGATQPPRCDQTLSCGIMAF